MDKMKFPFPDKELAMRELKADPTSAALRPEDFERLRDEAWDFGAAAARKVYEQTGEEPDFRKIFQSRGLEINTVQSDNVAGGRRYFSVYETGSDKVTLYAAAVRLWAGQNALDYDTAANLILSHEFFHYLEAHEVGYASKLVSLPIIRIGRWSIGQKGIRALSEIGAHAFARTYYDLCSDPDNENHGGRTE